MVWPLLIIAIAIVARSVSLDYGNPHVYSPDEEARLYEALRFVQALRDGNFSAPMGLASWLFLASTAGYAVIGFISGQFGTLAGLEHALLTADFHVFLAGRIAVALIGTLNALLTYWIARRATSEPVAVAAGLFYSVSAVTVLSAQILKLDVPVTCSILLATIAALRLNRNPTTRNALVAAAMLGLALAARWNAAPLLIPCVWVVWFHRRALGMRTTAAAAGVVIATYAVTSMTLLRIVGSILGHVNLYGTRSTNEALLSHFSLAGFQRLPQQIAANVGFYADAGWSTIPAAMLLAALGLVVAVRKRSIPLLLLVGFAAPYMLALFVSPIKAIRYALPVMFVVSILAATGVEAIAGTYRTWRPRFAMFTALVAVVITTSLVPVFRYHQFAMREDPRSAAASWIEAQVPKGAVIALEGFHELPTMLPQLQEHVETAGLRVLANKEAGQGTGAAARARLSLASEDGYRIISLSENRSYSDPHSTALENQYEWELLKGQGVEWVVLSATTQRGRSKEFLRDLEVGTRQRITFMPEPGAGVDVACRTSGMGCVRIEVYELDFAR